MESDVEIKPPFLSTTQYSCRELYDILNPIAAGYEGGSVLKSVHLSWRQCNQESVYFLRYEGNVISGDSGGPLFFQQDEDFTVIAIVKGGARKPGYPIYFAPMSISSNFINKYIQYTSTPDIGSGNSIYSGNAISKNISDWSLISHSASSAASPALVNLFSIILLTLTGIFLQSI